jgi:thioredoxin reductase (NADPH)
MDTKDLVIIGSGPAGLTAAIYAARANLSPLVFEGFMAGIAGGQLMTTTDVENFPGFPEGIMGPQLIENLHDQAVRFGSKFLLEDVLSIDTSSSPFKIMGAKTNIQAKSIIIATGANANRLDVPGAREGELWQKGVTACAVCDGAAPIFRNKDLYVIGGGDSAVEEALFLTKYGKDVYIVHRRDQLRASKVMAMKAENHPRIKILWNTTLVKVEGDDVVKHVILKNVATNKEEKKEAGGVFFAIGHTPNTKFLKDQLEINDMGYIIVKQGSTQTSVDGVFAAGDVQDYTYRQAVTAAGSGCMAALDVNNWMMHKGYVK